jgi:hypothetical protein
MKEYEAFSHIPFLLKRSAPKWEPRGTSATFASTWFLRVVMLVSLRYDSICSDGKTF